MRIVRLLQFIYILLKKTHINTSKQINMYEYVQPEVKRNWTLKWFDRWSICIFPYFRLFCNLFFLFFMWLLLHILPGQTNNSYSNLIFQGKNSLLKKKKSIVQAMWMPKRWFFMRVCFLKWQGAKLWNWISFMYILVEGGYACKDGLRANL